MKGSSSDKAGDMQEAQSEPGVCRRPLKVVSQEAFFFVFYTIILHVYKTLVLAQGCFHKYLN